MTRVTVRPRTAADELPAHLVPYWGRLTVDPRDDVNYCPKQSRRTPAIPWHNGIPTCIQCGRTVTIRSWEGIR